MVQLEMNAQHSGVKAQQQTGLDFDEENNNNNDEWQDSAQDREERLVSAAITQPTTTQTQAQTAQPTTQTLVFPPNSFGAQPITTETTRPV